MWLNILYYTKYKFNLRYKTIYIYTMLYLTMLKMISLKVLKDLKNNQTNLWPKHNPIILNKIMLNI